MESEKYEKSASYANTDIYVGIDVHKDSYKVAILIRDMIVKTNHMASDSEELIKHLRKNYPEGNYYSVYEAGFSGFKLHRDLMTAGIKNIIVNPADVPTSHKEKSGKTDKVDARKLARELSTGRSLRGISVPSEEEEGLRDIIRRRGQLVVDQTRIKNQIKTFIYKMGIKLPEEYSKRKWGESFIKYLEELKLPLKTTRMNLDSLLRTLSNVKKEIEIIVEETDKLLEEHAQAKKIINYLLTIPGIGKTIAKGIYGEILDINRFGSLNECASYAGLAPACHSSGDKEWITGITKRQNKRLRTFLIEAAWVAVKKDPALTISYDKLRNKLKPQEAIIRIARKLLNRIMYVWRNEKEYVMGVV